jgi:UDP-2-acetamido-3-amino-2,3-dideoxy-glucuronate N-acetyltransferase
VVSSRDFFVHPTAVVDQGAVIGKGTKIWHFSHIMKGAQIGERCIFGQNVNVDGGTKIGNNVKIQNNVSVYAGVEIEDDVFLGPSCVLTNVSNPRSQINRHSLYEKTVIRRGATVGANATIVCGVTLGRYSFVGAAAVVTKDVPDYALVLGNPARQRGWMSRHGHLLKPGPAGELVCPESGFHYQLAPAAGAAPNELSALDAGPSSSGLRCLDLNEEQPLPTELATGKAPYDSFKSKA